MTLELAIQVVPRHFFYNFLDLDKSNLVCYSCIGSLVRPKVVKSVHFCPTTGNFTAREYRDIASNMGLPTGSVYPTRVMSSRLLL